jgi:hypothetical protein
MPLSEQIGLEDIPGDQAIWRFLDRRKLSDLTSSGSLRLSRISELRKLDQRESRLPSVIREVLQRFSLNEDGTAFVDEMLKICEDQAFDTFASCWFLPGTREEELRMWQEFGGGNEGGVRISSTLRCLLSSLPTNGRRLFGIGHVRYIRDDISYPEVLALGQYHSMPFLLKLEDHINEREIRLFERFRLPQMHWDVRQEQPPCTRFRIADTNLIGSIGISPMCSSAIVQDITDELMQWRFPRTLIEVNAGTN